MLLLSVLLCTAAAAPDPVHAANTAVVLDFAGNAPQKLRLELSSNARAGVTDALASQPEWRLAAREETYPVLMAMGQEMDDCEKGRCKEDILPLMHAQAGILGEAMVVDRTMYVSIHFHDVKVGSRMETVTVQGEDQAVVYTGVRKATAEMVRKVLKLGGAAAQDAPKDKEKAGRKTSPQVLLLVAERLPGKTEFSLAGDGPVAVQAAAVLAAKGTPGVVDTSWLGKQDLAQAVESGEFPFEESRAAARKLGARQVLVVRVVEQDLGSMHGADAARTLTVMMYARLTEAEKDSFGPVARSNETLSCTAPELAACPEEFRTRALEPLLNQLWQPPAPPTQGAPKSK